MDRDVEKASTNSGTINAQENAPAFAPIQSTSRISKTQSRAEDALQHTRSQNGYSCDPDEDSQTDETEKDPFEVGFENGDQDPLCPRSFGKARKWIIVFIVSFASFCVTAASSIYTSTYAQMQAEFGNSRIVSTLGLSLFVLGIALGPLFMSPLSEFYGRRPIYLVSWTMYVIWIIPQAVAKNIETVLVGRFFDGFAGSAFLAVSGGTVGDLFAPNELQAPMLMFSIAPFVGPSIGPLIGGFINYNVDWRWTYYVMLIWAFGLLLGIVFLVPETYHPILVRDKARQTRKETGDERWKAPNEKTQKSVVGAIGRSLLRPFQLLIFEPMCLNLCIFSAILLGILYLFFGAFPLVFINVYGFNLWQVGLTFLGILVGMVLAAGLDPVWHRIRVNLIRQLSEESGVEGKSEPEFRLPPAILGSVLVPAGIFMFGWSCYPWVHWIVPIIGAAIFGAGTLLVFSGIFTFLVDAYPQYAASALAANAFVRCAFAAAFPLFGNQMYEKLNYHWASSLLAFLTVAMMPFPYIFFRHGKRIRANSRFATS
ncbi:MFS domain-containing protein [Fusarium keratoplasticum]|uniref:MFS domain-containing protein n=1 Tax=Fusarium keratoplasticum TaxID=1328300 RepID=A0ACC0R3R7_9HYPO|nr:MFS domain-containing protein [Fusarium keratoplasticum]KAI8674965.1 MFS domain-containing protein [Fusarium keratoplasticum]